MVEDRDRIRELVERERQRFDTPGVAVSVVRDGEVLLAEGFGQRDVEEAKPVTGDTLVPLASMTKSFTAALVGVCVQEGLLEWDRPVRDWLPWFRLRDPVASELATVRDLLSHRTGLPRHDLMWFGDPSLTRRELVERLRHLEPSRPFREVWQYNNLAYVTAGYLAGELLGTTFEDGVRKHLLEPLGMHRTTLSGDEYVADGDRVRPYEQRNGVLKAAAMREGTERLTSPAGGIISTASDMARWTIANLRPREDGGPLLSRTVLRELHRPAIVTESLLDAWPEIMPVGYALGWSVQAYRGHRVVQHGGNIEGISTQMHVLPDDGIAVVALTNVGGIGLRDTVPLMVADILLDLEPLPWGERYHDAWVALKGGMVAANRHQAQSSSALPPSHPIEDYAGVYEHPAYGRFTVTVRDDRLIPEFHSIPELTFTHRHHDVFNLRLESLDTTQPAAFRTGFDGTVEGLVIRLEPTVAPIVFDRLPDAEPLDEATSATIAGRYTMGPFELTVETDDGDVVADAGAAGRFELIRRRGTTFTVRDRPGMTVEFVLSEDAVERVVIDPLGVFVPAGG